MSVSLTLAKPDHLAALLPMVAAFHAEAEIDSTDEDRRLALGPLLEGSPLGAVYLMGPTRAPIGYVVITFGWSVEFGGMDGFVDEIFVRPAVRGRGQAGEVLRELPKALAKAGLMALHLEVRKDNEAANRLYHRCGFSARDGYVLMSRKL